MILSYDGPDTPLRQVTFCVVDLETTGASAATCAITEVGAAKFRGGECLGTFQTLVDAGVRVSPVAARITGISDDLLVGAPSLPGVLAALLEFAGGAVLVGHNLRFDVSFLDAALAAGQRAGLRLRMVDTVALARRLVGDDAPDCRLATLAEHLGLRRRPSHRALGDALATAELLHVLLERAAGLGVTTLDDLLALPRLAGHPQAAKLALTNDLPRAPGVYLLRDARHQPLYVGRARDIRRRVRSLFAIRRGGERGSEGRTVRQLLRAVHRIEHLVTASSLESAVAEVRLVQAIQPRHNRRTGRWRRFRYVRLPARPSGRPVVVPSAEDRGTYLGPFPSAAAARAVAAAAGHAGSPDAADPPDATDGGELAAVQRWYARIDSLRRAERVVLSLADGDRAELRYGRLVTAAAVPGPAPGAGPGPLTRQTAEELDVVAAWFDRWADRSRLVQVDGELACTWPPRPRPESPSREPPRPATARAGPPIAGRTRSSRRSPSGAPGAVHRRDRDGRGPPEAVAARTAASSARRSSAGARMRPMSNTADARPSPGRSA